MDAEMAALDIDVSESVMVLRGDQPVGLVAAVGDERAEVHRVLQDAGYTLAVAMQDGEERYFSVEDEDRDGHDEECVEEKPRICELSITLGVLQEDAEAAGVSSAEIDVLDGHLGSMPEPEREERAQAAARAVADRLPEGSEQRIDAEEIIMACWGEDDGEAPGDG